MKKMLVLMVMLVALSGAVFAGNLYVNDSNFEDGNQFYNGSAIIDADTLEGKAASDFVELSYVQSKESVWSKDLVGGGIGRQGVSYLLTGEKDIFRRFDTFIDYLKGIFVQKSELEILRTRVDELEALSLGLDLDQYQKHKAIETGSYGPYSCSEDACIRQIE